MEIVDNFINPVLQNQIENTILSDKIIWIYSKSGTTDYNYFIDSNTTDSPQFVHHIYNDIDKQPLPHDIQIILYCMEDYFDRSFYDRLVRIKVNMLIKNPTYPIDNYHIPHSDYGTEDSESAIYYVNDSDGDTFLFNELASSKPANVTLKKRISPTKGRLMLFNSSYLHASSSPIISNERVVINFLFKK
jgi:hypothetical protein